MITKLTNQQRANISLYTHQSVSKITNVDRLDYNETQEIVNKYISEILGNDPMTIVLVDNPIDAWVCCCMFYLQPDTTPNNVVDKMKRFFNGNPDKLDMPNPTPPYQTGSLYASTFGFYDFFISEFDPKKDLGIDKEIVEKFKIWKRTEDIGMIFPLAEKNVCVVSQKPTEIYLNESRSLHRDLGPAVVYAGEADFTLYYLNGVEVPEYLALTPSHELSTDQFLNEKNADVRAEFIRKFGVENLIGLGNLVDSYENYDEEWWDKSQYELWNMSELFTSKDYAPYLKMKNQTTNVWHFEGVSPKCQTLTDAIKERFGGLDFSISQIA